MSRRVQVEYGTTPTLEFYPPEDGVPSSATVTIYAAGTSALVGSTAATVDSYAEAVTAVAKGDQVLTVTAQPVSGRRYWLADADGLGSEVVCRGGTSTRFVLEQRTTRAIASGTVSGRRLSYDLTSSVTGTLRRYLRVRWAYTIGGRAVSHQHLLDVVWWPWALDVGEDDLERVLTTFSDNVGDYREWTKLVAQATEDVRREVAGNIPGEPDLVRDRSLLVPAAVWRTLQLRYMRDQSDRYERCGKEYAAALATFYKSRAWYDSDDDLVRDLAGTGSSRTVQLSDGSTIFVHGAGAEHDVSGEVMGAPMRKLKVG